MVGYILHSKSVTYTNLNVLEQALLEVDPAAKEEHHL